MSNQLATMRYLIIPRVVQLAAPHLGLGEDETLRRFYHSRVNALLEDEETGFWHLSAHMIASMFQDEQLTGSFAIPHEV